MRCNLNFCFFIGSLARPTYGLRVPFEKTLKTFNEIVLTLFSVESNKNILYISISFTGNAFFGFSRYRWILFPEPLFLNIFEPLPSQRMLLQYFCHTNSPRFCYASLVLEKLICYIFFIKMNFFGSNLFL